MVVKLKKNSPHRDLTYDQGYFVIGIEANTLRILNDSGRPSLYAPELFTIVDSQEPDDWVTEFGDDGERLHIRHHLTSLVSLLLRMAPRVG